ncbi:hypothetical protein M426DRAFT_107347 [Hypoxylon sp. CI-4A]|nr:hypothetical protein M426DRAFT_107347 [Hypoxylon sp. CI-4A]
MQQSDLAPPARLLLLLAATNYRCHAAWYSRSVAAIQSFLLLSLHSFPLTLPYLTLPTYILPTIPYLGVSVRCLDSRNRFLRWSFFFAFRRRRFSFGRRMSRG